MYFEYDEVIMGVFRIMRVLRIFDFIWLLMMLLSIFVMDDDSWRCWMFVCFKKYFIDMIIVFVVFDGREVFDYMFM